MEIVELDTPLYVLVKKPYVKSKKSNKQFIDIHRKMSI